MASKLQLYVLVPAAYTGANGATVSEDRLLRVPDEFAGIDFNALSPSVRNALLNTFDRVYIDPATLSTSCNVTITPPTTDPGPVIPPPAGGPMYGLAQLSADNVIFRVGPDAAGGTTIKLTEWPTGYENFTGTYDMTPSNDGPYSSLDGKYTKFTKAYGQAPAGRYVAKMVQAGKTYYAAVTKQVGQASAEIALSFSETPPTADAMLGDITWVVNADRTATASGVASGPVEITPPKLAPAGSSYVGASLNSNSFGYKSGVLAGNDQPYVGNYRLTGTATSKPYSFYVPKGKIQQIDFAYLAPSASYSIGRWQLWVKTNYSDVTVSVQTSELIQALESLVDPTFNFYRQSDQNGQREETFVIKLNNSANQLEDQTTFKRTLGTSDIARQTVYHVGDDVQTGLPAVQNVIINPVTPKDPTRCNITLTYDATTETYGFIDQSNPDKLGRSNSYEWMYFLDDQWLTRDEFHRFRRPRNFPSLVVKVLTDVSQPKVKWRWQNIMAWEETQFLQYR